MHIVEGRKRDGVEKKRGVVKGAYKT